MSLGARLLTLALIGMVILLAAPVLKAHGIVDLVGMPAEDKIIMGGILVFCFILPLRR